MQHFAAAIFDMDGLLLDSERLALQSFNQAADEQGLGDLTAIFVQCIGVNLAGVREILHRELGERVDVVAFERRWKALYSDLTVGRAIPLKEGALALLQHCRSLDLPVALATSTSTALAEEKLRMAGLLAFFKVIVGGDQVDCGKPSPESFLKAAARLAVDPTRCIAFEDSSNGVKSAVAAGMTVVQVPDLVAPNQALLNLGHRVLPSLNAVLSCELVPRNSAVAI